MHRIVYKIRQDGTVHEEVQCVEVYSCERLTKEIEQALGEISERKHKPEYYQKENVTLQYNKNEIKE